MIRWLFIAIGLALTICAGLAIWHAVHDPTFWAAAIGLAASAVASVVIPAIVKRKTPEGEALDHDRVRRGEDTATKAHGHGGDG